MSQSAPARHPSTIATLPGQVLALEPSGGGGGGGGSGSAAAASPAVPVLTRAFSVGALPTTPRLEGFIVNWCRFHASHPILGAFHHVNHSNILAGGRNKFFDDSLVTPIQYQEVKRLRHNPYVGGGYIRSHTTLFHDLHIGYWAKERMAAREQRKQDMVSELKRPRLTQDVVQAVSAASSPGLLRSAESAESASAATAPTASRERGSSGPAVVGADGGVGGVSFGSVAANPASGAPAKKKAVVEPQYTLASLVSPRSLRRPVDSDAASTNSVGSAPAAVSGSPLPSTSTVAAVAMATLAAGRAAGHETRSAGKVSGSGGGGSGSRMGPTFSQLLGRHGDGEHEQKLPPSHSAARRGGAAAAGESPRAGRAIPATMLDAHHGKSRRFEDFYTFEKLPPMSVRVMPKLRAGPDGATAGTSGAAAGAAAAERDTKTAETEAQRVRQLGTEAKSGSMVGRGAYSSVRVGTHISTGDRFAIKQISKRYLYSEEEREAIRREVRIHCSPALAHDNIVFLYDYFEDEQTFYLVLDHCEGGDLETYMRVNKRKGVTELQAQMLFQQLMKALAFLHDQNIIHGDIKPQNVLLSRKPFAVVKICDFGNARYAKDVRYFSKTGSVSKVPYTSIMGTQGYIAPEILAKQHYGTGIDMWAAGIMCFFMLGGYQPFNPPSACLKCTTGPDFNDPCWSKFSEACMDFIARLLQRDPAKRMTAADARTHPWIVGL